MNAELIEGDFIETREKLIFEVKGLTHPKNGYYAFLRYVPDEFGDRVKRGVKYRKVYGLEERFEFLSKSYPNYVLFDERLDRFVQFVEKRFIKRVFKATGFIDELRSHRDELTSKALKLLDLLSLKASLKAKSIGVTGSILLRLHREDSDIDLVIHGLENSFRAYEAIKKMIGGLLEQYSSESLRKHVHSRWFKLIDCGLVKLNELMELEAKKISQGLFEGREYFIRFIPSVGEVDPPISYRFERIGEVIVKCVVADDKYSIFTPNMYLVEDVKHLAGAKPRSLRVVFSYRGRFAEQASEGEWVIVKGTLERVYEGREYLFDRVILESTLDYIFPENTLVLEKLPK